MSTQFNRNREEAVHDLNEARDALLRTVKQLGDGALAGKPSGPASESSLSNGQARYGSDGPEAESWVVRTVFEHLVLTDGGIAAAIAQCKDPTLPSMDEAYGRLLWEARPITSVVDAIRALEDGRQAVLAACDGMDEVTFTEMKPVREGDELFSPLTWLQHVADHDREHHEQLRVLLDEGGVD